MCMNISMRVSSLSFLRFLPCDCGGGERVAPECILDRYASCRFWDRPQKQQTTRTRTRRTTTTTPRPWRL